MRNGRIDAMPPGALSRRSRWISHAAALRDPVLPLKTVHPKGHRFTSGSVENPKIHGFRIETKTGDDMVVTADPSAREKSRTRPRARNDCLRHAISAVTLLAFVVLWHPGSIAADVDEPSADPPQEQSPSAEESNPKAPECFHGCLRWGQACDVDPRGVRKCRRRCEKFGKICE
jgi:hypothetical protein